jgi:NADPH:quinone reductase
MIQRQLEDAVCGALRIVIDRTLPLGDAAVAYAFIESREAFGRVVLIP